MPYLNVRNTNDKNRIFVYVDVHCFYGILTCFLPIRRLENKQTTLSNQVN